MLHPGRPTPSSRHLNCTATSFSRPVVQKRRPRRTTKSCCARRIVRRRSRGWPGRRTSSARRRRAPRVDFLEVTHASKKRKRPEAIFYEAVFVKLPWFLVVVGDTS